MLLTTRSIIFPEGDSQEIEHRLAINQLVDLNGNPLALPVKTVRVIAYRVRRISTVAHRNGELVGYHLELVGREELEELVGGIKC